jgi:hypothetical protein
MRPPWRWLSSRSLLTLSILTGVGVALLLVLWPSNPVTRANFRKIQVGMSQAELRSLLGPPEYQTVESGLVDGPEVYVTNQNQSDEERRQRGFREYLRQQWTSAEIEIVSISDSEGTVVCRYSGEGRRLDWIAFLRSWLSRWF